MFDWMFDKRIRVRVNFVTCWFDYYENEANTKLKILGMLASYDGTHKDKIKCLRFGSTSEKFYKECNFSYGEYKKPDMDLDFYGIKEGAYIEFDCWESTFNKIKKLHYLPFHNAKIVGEAL